MQIAKSILDLIGNTPLVKLNSLTKDVQANVLVKLEYLNPSGRQKDRIALKMIEEAEKEGALKPGFTIIEASTGNTGISLSFVGALKGYRVVIDETIPGKLGKEKIKMMQNYGAKVIEMVPEELEKQRKKCAGAEIELPGRRICLELESKGSGVWWARQFSNPNNVKAHNETAREILNQTNGRVDVFGASIGTGGLYWVLLKY